MSPLERLKAALTLKQFALLLVQGVVILLLLWGAEWWMSRDVARGELPEIEGVTLDGEWFVGRSLRGQVWLLHVWAVWCPICTLEQGSIHQLAQEYPILTVALQSGDHEAVSRYLTEQQVRYPVWNDSEGKLSRELGVDAVPVSLIIDRQQRVQFVTHGYTSIWGLRLRLWLTDWLF